MKKYISFLITLMLASVAYADMTWVEDGHENVVVKKLAGTWEGDDLLTRRLIGDPPDGEKVSIGRLTFTEDHKVFETLKRTPFAKTTTTSVFCAGKISVENEGQIVGEVLYAVLQMDHNMVIAWYVNDDWESQHVALAQGLSAEKDILFLGGDRVSEPMVAFSRVRK